MVGNYLQAVDYLRKALAHGRRHGYIVPIHTGMLNLGKIALFQGNIAEAEKWFQEDLAYTRNKGHESYIADVQFHLGRLAWEVGDMEGAGRRYTEALNFYRGSNSNWEMVVLVGLGKVAQAQGDTSQALARFRQALGIPIALLDITYLFDPRMITFEAIALLAVTHRKLESNPLFLADSIRLLSATQAWHTQYFYIRSPREQQEREACITALRVALDAQAFDTAWKEGQAMSEEQVVEYALGISLSTQETP